HPGFAARQRVIKVAAGHVDCVALFTPKQQGGRIVRGNWPLQVTDFTHKITPALGAESEAHVRYSNLSQIRVALVNGFDVGSIRVGKIGVINRSLPQSRANGLIMGDGQVNPERFDINFVVENQWAGMLSPVSVGKLGLDEAMEDVGALLAPLRPAKNLSGEVKAHGVM